MSAFFKDALRLYFAPVIMPLQWLVGRWRERQRSLDIELLWPCCRELAASLDEARAVFAVHCFMDPAWRCLGDEEICRRIDLLR